jgi:hypothetical protein
MRKLVAALILAATLVRPAGALNGAGTTDSYPGEDKKMIALVSEWGRCMYHAYDIAIKNDLGPRRAEPMATAFCTPEADAIDARLHKLLPHDYAIYGPEFIQHINAELRKHLYQSPATQRR